MSDNLGASLRQRRKADGLTLKQLSERCGLSVSYLSDLERSIRNPSIQTLRKIADVYGLELFVGFKRKETP